MPFAEQVEDAYEHLYDLVYLRTHPLVDLLVRDPSLSRKDSAWRLHHILLEAIDELDPGPQAPTFSREWRRHRLMVLRYVDGLDPQAVADQIAISLRHYYREQEAAVEAVTQVLADRYLEQQQRQADEGLDSARDGEFSRLELLRLEAVRAAQADRRASLGEVVASVLSLLENRLAERRLQVQVKLPDTLPPIMTERSLLRQTLLGMLSYLIERSERAALELAASEDEVGLHLSLAVVPPEAVQPAPQTEVQERLAAIGEVTALAGARLLPTITTRALVGFEVEFRTGRQRTVLTVDDNEDALELFRRLLSLHGYRVVLARSTAEAVDMARQLHPQVIIADLLMPEQDGWDLLHILLDQADTRDIPVIVCSVLRQKELALSLGATAFLEKPITEETLLSLLRKLQGT